MRAQWATYAKTWHPSCLFSRAVRSTHSLVAKFFGEDQQMMALIAGDIRLAISSMNHLAFPISSCTMRKCLLSA